MEEQGYFWIAIGLALLGYFIGNGLKQMNHPQKTSMDYYLIEESNLHTYLSLSREEVKDLISKYPNAPKIELNGKIYYNYQHLINWISSEELYKN